MENLFPFFSYVFVVTFTPGPNNIMSMAIANKYSFKKSLNFRFGVFTGFFIIMLMSSYFNLLLFRVIPRIKVFMGIVGAIYMTYLAIKIIQSKNNSDKNDSRKTTSFITGISMQFVNAKGILYAITVVSNFIIPYYKSNIALFLFSILLPFIAFISVTCWALFGALFQKFLSKYWKIFNYVMGLLLLYSAVKISGITHLFN